MSVRPGARNHAYAQRRAPKRRSAGPGFSGWTGLLIGLVIGLAIAAGVWRVKSRPPAEPVAKTKNAAPLSAREEATPEPATRRE